jgi:hypothetical protein
MRVAHTTIVGALLAACLCACGDTGSTGSVADRAHEAGSALAPRSRQGVPRASADHDGDEDNKTGSLYEADDKSVPAFGHRASGSDLRELRSLAERYYAAAAAQNGAAACLLIGAALREGLVEQHGGASGPSRAGDCASVVAKLLRSSGRSATELAGVAITGAFVEEGRGSVMLRLPDGEIRYLPVEREGGTWKVGSILDQAVG